MMFNIWMKGMSFMPSWGVGMLNYPYGLGYHYKVLSYVIMGCGFGKLTRKFFGAGVIRCIYYCAHNLSPALFR